MAKPWPGAHSFSARKRSGVFFAVAIPTWHQPGFDNFGGVALLLLPLSLALTAEYQHFTWGRSLAPIKDLTMHAALMANASRPARRF